MTDRTSVLRQVRKQYPLILWAVCLSALLARPVTASQHQPGVGYPKGVPQLKPMFISEKLFTPDKHWEYEEYEPEVPHVYAVGQTGKVSIGGEQILNRGALVQYLVSEFPNREIAHTKFQHAFLQTENTNVVRRLTRPVPVGDEAVETIETDYHGTEPLRFMRVTVARYGRCVVRVIGRSDMRAFGPRPRHGERPWLSEPVYTKVLEQVLGRWKNYRSLIPAAASEGVH